VTGNLDPVTGRVLSLSALVTKETDRAKLRTELGAMVNDAPDSPAFNYWLARYALVAGDYATARTAARLAHGFGDVNTTILPIADPPPQPQQPDTQYPENFYTYRDDLVEQVQLDQLRSQLETLAVGDYTKYLANTGVILSDAAAAGAFAVFVGRARLALSAINAWQTGNRHAVNRELSAAMQNYQDCQSLAAEYFGHIANPSQGAAQLLQKVLQDFEATQTDDQAPALWSALRWRRILLSLKELEDWDRSRVIGTDGAFAAADAFVANMLSEPGQDVNGTPFPSVSAQTNHGSRLDYLMIVMSTIWVPLAIGELNAQMRQFDAAVDGLAAFVSAETSSNVQTQFGYLCEFIEIPFVRLVSADALLDKADAQYKAGLTDLASQTYQQVLSLIDQDGHQYATLVGQAPGALATAIQSSLANKDTTSLAFRSLGKQLTVPGIAPATNALPGLDRTLAPHQSMITIGSPDNRDNNPRLYAIGLLATARLEQIKNDFNYLGYPPDYVPPWRFSFLLDRARYFAEHAKNTQRDYLNFLNNAEHEEFQEQGMAQNVEMEQANVKIEAAKVDQAQAQVHASQTSAELASQTATDAQDRLQRYREYEAHMNELDFVSAGVKFVTGVAALAEGSPTGLQSIADAISQTGKEAEQRGLEEHNLELNVKESQKAAIVANAKLAVDQAGLVVAGLQRQAALLRHEFAVQNLAYLRNQTMNSDQWFRLANSVRAISDTYLRYAIALAFLAQQAYEFEMDRAMDVIRFDYDLSDVGSMLAADFLLRDLDSLEQDLLVSQQTRMQQVRYVLSMAREFPETLRNLAESGRVTFAVPLEHLERHFPGLFNLRISSVDVQPVALMDPTRVSLELTQTGSGFIRLKAQPGTSPLNSADLPADTDWLGNANTDWPAKLHLSGPETNLFSGLSRQEATSLSPITAGERGAFEGLPAASTWQIDMSMKENQVVPGSLADVLLTFNLSGYYDPEFKGVVTGAAAAAPQLATTSFVSARSSMPDAFYSLVHEGTMEWDVTDDLLTSSGPAGALRNLAVLLPLVAEGPELGRCYCRYDVELAIAAADGAVTVRTQLPELSLTPNGLTLSAAYTGAAGAQVTWDFGDGSAIASGTTAQHLYARPGRYEVLARIARGGRLSEYRAAVVVSESQTITPPLIAVPSIAVVNGGPGTGPVDLKVQLATAAADVAFDCVVGQQRAVSSSGVVTIQKVPRGQRIVLTFQATRNLSAHLYGRQVFLPNDPVALSRMRATTNRTFKGEQETTSQPNALTTHIFGANTPPAVLSAADRWTLELPLATNPCFLSVSSSDVTEFDGGELGDAVLSLEYED
jgi:hypothetical protein